MSRPTIHDVARVAGVSLSTVDRVLNGRLSVRHATRTRVEEAIRDLGYLRNSAAANLSRRRSFRFEFILPSGANSFMRMLEAEVRNYAAGLRADNVTVTLTQVPPFDAPALVECLKRVGAEEPDGVAFVAVDTPAVRDVVRGLASKGSKIVTLVSDLPSDLRDHFVGIDNIWAGRTAAGLLGRFCGRSRGRVAVVAGSMVVQDHAERWLGFQQVMAADFPHLELLSILEAFDDATMVETQVSKLISDYGRVTGIYSLGAGNRGLIAAIGDPPARPHVVVHELTEHSRRWLQNDRIDAVIRQDPAREARSAIRTLLALANGRSFDMDENRVGIEIFLRDNLP
ncbi:LacI family transcriptional regulator [Palleronia aestuarii]|uniref:LacI family transcriptional regulator n=1 Tax=Palleronia aestuarii TaxID=568105 RepID=A0A2W7P0H7_9RHOB|nr:LacI family DNA-binding transcriptional regulator [Palleronia aestuarii]PZX16952.1 LacI family transcriptional regulator [Palleronia aestuarii]